MHLKTRSLQNKLATVSSCLLLSFCQPIFANEAETLKQLNELVKAKKYQQALDLANQHVMDYGGEAKFDFLMGMAALKLKAYEESVFALERAVINQPKWQQARFQLAKAYYHVDNLASAKNELVKLKADSNNTDFINVIERFIEQVDDALVNKKRQFRQMASVSISSDSNINSGTTVENIYIDQLGTSIPLAQASRETEDVAFNFNYQALYQEPLTQNLLLIGQVSLFRTDYQDTPAFELTMADVSLKYQDVLADMTYQVGAFFRPLILDKTHYRDQYGLSSNWSLPLNLNWSLGWQLGFGKIDSRINTSLDVRDVFATVSAKYRIGRWQHVVSANHTDIRSVEPKTKHQSYHYYKLDYKTSYILTSNQQLTFDLQWQKFNYDVQHPVFKVVREEDFVRSTLGWRYIMNDWMMWQVQYRYSRKDSNEAIFSYDRNEFNLGLTMQF